MDAPAVAVTADGKKRAAAWMDLRSGGKNVYWALPSGTGFAPDAALSENAQGRRSHPTLVYDEAGTLYAAWESEDSIYFKTTAAPKERGMSEGASFYPNLATNGKLVVLVFESGKGVMCRVVSGGK